MRRWYWGIFFAFLTTATMVGAQGADQVWLQIQARPSLSEVKKRLQFYAGKLPDVNGFHMRGRWYAVVLGPYTRARAEELRSDYISQGLIPADAYLAKSSDYKRQIWPVGANNAGANEQAQAPAVVDPAAPEPSEPAEQQTVLAMPSAPQPGTAPAPVERTGGPRPTDESKDEALKSERALSREERAELQKALAWVGVYNGAVDAAFGQGTRAAMGLWQEQNNFQKTGILTIAQRAELLTQYNAVFEGMGLQTVRDEKAGIEMTLPLDVVEFGKYDYPFVHYDPKGENSARVLLISQSGNQATLKALFDVMQTLTIVPKEGPRRIKKNAFTLVGQNAEFISHTEVRLQDKAIKGFTLIWPANDAARQPRLLQKMRESFETFDGVLESTDIAIDDQRADLMAGLEVRKPKQTRSGFYVDQNGAVLTVVDVTQSCERLTINDVEASVLASDPALGLAILRPSVTLSPPMVARVSPVPPRLQSDVAVAGFSYGGILGAATVSFGKLADLQGLDGDDRVSRLEIKSLDGDVGGPVFEANGNVIGVLQPMDIPGRSIPENVAFSTAPKAMAEFLQRAGITVSQSVETDPLAPERLTREARKISVLVECWG